MTGEEAENAAELKIEFLKAKCLMNCEVVIIPEHKYEVLRGRFPPGDPGNDKIDKMLNDLSLINKFE